MGKVTNKLPKVTIPPGLLVSRALGLNTTLIKAGNQAIKNYGYPPKSSNLTFSFGMPISSSILSTAAFIMGGPQR